MNDNSVLIAGRVCRTSRLRYTPQGIAVFEFMVATTQSHLGKSSVGYFDVVATGDLAEAKFCALRIGRKVSLKGGLWSRSFRDRRGQWVKETKILAESLESVKEPS